MTAAQRQWAAGRLLLVLLGLVGFALPTPSVAAPRDLPAIHKASSTRTPPVVQAADGKSVLVAPAPQIALPTDEVQVQRRTVGFFTVVQGSSAILSVPISGMRSRAPPVRP